MAGYAPDCISLLLSHNIFLWLLPAMSKIPVIKSSKFLHKNPLESKEKYCKINIGVDRVDLRAGKIQTKDRACSLGYLPLKRVKKLLRKKTHLLVLFQNSI